MVYSTMYYVYFLTSNRRRNYVYVGFTNNVERRYAEHNASSSTLSTAPYRPLILAGYVAVTREDVAIELEQYFKKGSGKAILKKRILRDSQKNGLTKPVNVV